MCGRYASSMSATAIVDEFEVEQSEVEQPLAPDFNVAPTKDVYAVLSRRIPADTVDPLDPPDAASRTVRRLCVATWGLVPSWAKDARGGARLINARVETVAEKPAFRRAFAVRRCLLPADGYYEWLTEPGTRSKQAYFIRPRDASVLAMAGIYELWRPEEGAPWLRTCAVITTDATDDLGQIHERMPMLVERESWAAWLDLELTEPDDVAPLLVPALPDASTPSGSGPR